MARRLGGVVSTWCGVGAHREVERGRHGEPGHVDDEAPADADVGDEQTADRRPDQDAELHPEAGQRVGGRDLVVADGPRHQGLAAGPLQGSRRGQQPGDPEDDRDAGLVAERVDGEHGGEHGLADARPDEQAAAVHVVGERAAVQPEHHQRHQLDQADRADGEVGARQVVDLERDRDVGDHPAEVEDRPRQEQQPEVPRGPQRGDVHAHAAEAVTPRPALGHEGPC